MAQYIDKEVLLAEIEKRKIPFKRDVEDGYYPTYLCALMDFEDFLDTLEVKDIDLEKEIQSWVEDNSVNGYYREDVYETARYFFELGLKAQKGEQS